MSRSGDWARFSPWIGEVRCDNELVRYIAIYIYSSNLGMIWLINPIRIQYSQRNCFWLECVMEQGIFTKWCKMCNYNPNRHSSNGVLCGSKIHWASAFVSTRFVSPDGARWGTNGRHRITIIGWDTRQHLAVILLFPTCLHHLCLGRCWTSTARVWAH